MAWQVWRAPSCWVLAKGVSPTPRSLRPTIFRSWCCWDFHGNFDGTGCIWVWQVPVMLGYFNSPLPRFATKARHLRAVVRLVWLQPWQHPGYARLRDRCHGGSGGDEHHTVSSHWRHHRLHLGLCHHQEIRRGWPVQWHPGRPKLSLRVWVGFLQISSSKINLADTWIQKNKHFLNTSGKIW